MSNKDADFTITFESPLVTKVERLAQFVKENELLGLLDKRYIAQWLSEFDKMHVTKLVAHVMRRRGVESWTLRATINNLREFEGRAPNFEEAIIGMCENLEMYLVEAKSA